MLSLMPLLSSDVVNRREDWKLCKDYDRACIIPIELFHCFLTVNIWMKSFYHRFVFTCLCVHYTCLSGCLLKLSAILYSSSLWSLCEKLDILFFVLLCIMLVCPSPNLSHIYIFLHLQCINVKCVSCMNNCSQSASGTAHPFLLTFSILILNCFL